MPGSAWCHIYGRGHYNCYLALRSKVRVKVKDQGQISGMQVVVVIRGSALQSVAKSNNPYYHSKVCVCNQWAYVDNCADAVDWLLIYECTCQFDRGLRERNYGKILLS